MTVKECYEAMGADYEDVVRRLRKDERVQKFLLKLLDDKSYANLCTAMEENNAEEAFRAAHTIKGVCQNLSLVKLYESGSELSEKLRGRTEIGDDLGPLLEQVKADYNQMISCITQLKEQA